MATSILSERIGDANYGLSLAKRPDSGGSKGRSIDVYANFYPVKINFDKLAYQYDVDISCTFVRKDGSLGEFMARREQRKEVLKDALAMGKIDKYVFDGEKILFLLDKHAKLEYNLTKTNKQSGEQETFRVVLSYAASVDLSAMKFYMDKKTNELPLTSINLLDLLYRQNRMDSHVYEKRSLFNINEKGEYLGEGLVYYPGLYQSIKACEMGWLQNIDFESCVFYQPTSLIDFMANNGIRHNPALDMPVDTKRQIERLIKGLMITPTHLNKDRRYRVNGLVQPANKLEFELKDKEDDSAPGRMITVDQYFKETYQITLKYPKLPCVSVGDPKQSVAFPLEICKIAQGQRYKKKLTPSQQAKIARGTVFDPKTRMETVDRLVKQSVHDKNLLAQFGLIEDSQGSKAMMKVKARLLDSISLKLQAPQPIQVRCGKFQIANQKLLTSPNLAKWIIIWRVRPSRQEQQTQLMAGLQEAFKVHYVGQFKPPVVQTLPSSEFSVEQVFEMIQSKFPNPELVIMVISDRVQDEYSTIKLVAETKYGIMTQCINFENLSKQLIDKYKLSSYMDNLMLKINSKLGGVNFKADFANLNRLKISPGEPVMFMGADVTNFGGEDRSSIAAVVASYDMVFGKYSVRLSEQKNSNENRKSQEIILDLEEIAYQLIEVFKRNNKQTPKRIIFYRDGIDSGQFQKVLDFELQAVQRACRRHNFTAKITIIVVQKRNHTRLFPVDDKNKTKSGNILPGTVVSSEITNKNQFDFYLCSHEAIRGTAKVTHYIVIHDDNELSSDDVQNLTFDLCHLFARSTKAVSIPAPAFYAHLVAYRGRLYETKKSDGASEGDDNELSEDELNQVRHHLIEIHSNLEEKMFFC